MLVQLWYHAWSLIHRWSGRNHREKISTQVAFDEVLDIKPFCDKSEVEGEESYTYNLMGVIIHHGRGFGSGHYTACCWNAEASKSTNKTNVCLLWIRLFLRCHWIYHFIPESSHTQTIHLYIRTRLRKTLINFNRWLT